jgi:hypothetical protein
MTEPLCPYCCAPVYDGLFTCVCHGKNCQNAARANDLANAKATDPFDASEIKRLAVQANVSVDVLTRIVNATMTKLKERDV